MAVTRGPLLLSMYSKPWSCDVQPRIPVWQRVLLIGSTIGRLDLLSAPKLKSVIIAWDLTLLPAPQQKQSGGKRTQQELKGNMG